MSFIIIVVVVAVVVFYTLLHLFMCFIVKYKILRDDKDVYNTSVGIGKFLTSCHNHEGSPHGLDEKSSGTPGSV